MEYLKSNIEIFTNHQGLYEITQAINNEIIKQGINEGLCVLQILHTSASLIISENADPTAKRDLELFMNKLVPENQNWHTHTLEGTDDSPSHMKSILTQTNMTMSIENGALVLGTWQGVYLFEHRKISQRRHIRLSFLNA